MLRKFIIYSKLQSFPIFLISGVGDKGYQTLELRLVGPILAVSGALLVCCRVMMCFMVIIQCWSDLDRNNNVFFNSNVTKCKVKHRQKEDQRVKWMVSVRDPFTTHSLVLSLAQENHKIFLSSIDRLILYGHQQLALVLANDEYV